MTGQFARLFGLAAATLGLAACMNSTAILPHADAAVPVGLDLGASSRAPAPSRIALAHEGHADADGTGVVNSVNAAQRMINLSHQPIKSLGWPAMTMDFPVTASVDLTAVKAGSRVNFTLGKGPDGMYQVEALSLAEASR